MKITKVEPIMLCYTPTRASRDGLANIPTKDVFLVKIYTDEGIVGIGEGFALGCLRSVNAALEETIAPLLIGEDPCRIEYLWNKVYQQTFRYGRRGILICALSAVDIALWDIMGKAANMPLFKLIGGASESLIPYASAGYYAEGKTVSDLVDEVLSYKEKGYKIMKMKIGGAPFEEDKERINAVCQAVGEGFRIAVDANNAYDFNDALRMGRLLDKYDAFFFEEPVSSDHIEDSIRLAAALDVPIAGYETQPTRIGMRDFVTRDAVDIVQLDCIWSGGITECLKLGSLAAAWNKPVIPHFSASMVSLAVNLHLGMALPNDTYFEYMMDENPLREELSLYPITIGKDGLVRVPDLPGIGVVLNEEIVSKYRVY